MKGKLFHALGIVVVLSVLIAGCAQEESAVTEQMLPSAPMAGLSKKGGGAIEGNGVVEGTASEAAIAMMSDLNAMLEVQKKGYQIGVMEFVTADGLGQYGTTVYAKNVGNKQLGHHFVPGDPRRGGGVNITYITDYSEGAATGPLNADETTFEIDRAMDVWKNQQCSGGLGITNLGALNFDLGYVQFLVGLGGVQGWAADLTHAGWLPKVFFDIIGGPGGGNSILGVTFTFIWTQGGVPTDIDNNGKLDVAFREIYYNNNFTWRLGSWTGGANYQAFGVILHEAGHGLSQGHFGQVFLKNDGSVQYAPQAVMNAVVSRRTTVSELAGTDNGGHCSIWGSWPNN